MCPGINGFTKYAPIADWGRKRLGGAYMAVFAMCASRGRVAEARTHRKRRVVCATRPRGQGRRETTKIKIRKTNLECALKSTVSLFGISLHRRRLGVRVGWWVAHTWRRLPCVRPEIVAEAVRCKPALTIKDLNELPALSY